MYQPRRGELVHSLGVLVILISVQKHCFPHPHNRCSGILRIQYHNDVFIVKHFFLYMLSWKLVVQIIKKQFASHFLGFWNKNMIFNNPLCMI